MSGYRRLSCRMALWRTAKSIRLIPDASRKLYSSPPPPQEPPKAGIDIDELLGPKKWTWSVQALLPKKNSQAQSNITSAQLHHLCRLSALSPPKTPEEELKMMKTLESQLHFVREIQSIDTAGVEPLVSIRDETSEGRAERSIGRHTPAIAEALKNEEFKGRNKRPRRKRDVPVYTKGAEDWDVMGLAERKQGRYFVVDSSKSSAVE